MKINRKDILMLVDKYGILKVEEELGITILNVRNRIYHERR